MHRPPRACQGGCYSLDLWWTCAGHTLMQSLSHFSFHNSNGGYLLCDLQGRADADFYTLTTLWCSRGVACLAQRMRPRLRPTTPRRHHSELYTSSFDSWRKACLTSDPRVAVTALRARVPRWSLQPDR